jgi:hypothetical protein
MALCAMQHIVISVLTAHVAVGLSHTVSTYCSVLILYVLSSLTCGHNSTHLEL